jgi:hypothetical protein
MFGITGDLYVHIKNKTVVLVTGVTECGTRGEIVTVTPMGDRVRPRTVPVARLNSYLTRAGKPRKSGYVAVRQLPLDNRLARLPAITRAHAVPDDHKPTPFTALRTEDANLGDLTDDALVIYLDRLDLEAKEAQKRFEDAKNEAKSRSSKKGGLVIVGDVALEMHNTSRVDDKLARANLTPEQYQSVAVLKIDTGLARERLAEADLAKVLKPQGMTLKVRQATDEDREKAVTAAVDAFGRPMGTRAAPLESQMGADALVIYLDRRGAA